MIIFDTEEVLSLEAESDNYVLKYSKTDRKDLKYFFYEYVDDRSDLIKEWVTLGVDAYDAVRIARFSVERHGPRMKIIRYIEEISKSQYIEFHNKQADSRSILMELNERFRAHLKEKENTEKV